MSRFPALWAIALLLFTVVKSCCATTTNLYFVFVSFFSFIKKPALYRSRLILYILKKYQYGSLTPCLRKKTPPRKPYCICIFCHFINIVLQIWAFFWKNNKPWKKFFKCKSILNIILLRQRKPETYTNIGVWCGKRKRCIWIIHDFIKENTHLKTIAQHIFSIGFNAECALSGRQLVSVFI